MYRSFQINICWCCFLFCVSLNDKNDLLFFKDTILLFDSFKFVFFLCFHTLCIFLLFGTFQIIFLLICECLEKYKSKNIF